MKPETVCHKLRMTCGLLALGALSFFSSLSVTLGLSCRSGKLTGKQGWLESACILHGILLNV